MNDAINKIINHMIPNLNSNQIVFLNKVLNSVLSEYELKHIDIQNKHESNSCYLNKFIASKSASGLSSRTLDNYKLTLSMFIDSVNKPISDISDDDVLIYLEKYRQSRHVSFARIRNMQSAISSFFNFLVKKKIVKSNPVNQLDPIKVPKTIKKSLTDAERELLKMNCSNARDLSIIEFLYSTGVRVSELTSLNITDVDFINGDIVVNGKGSKERHAYMTPSCSLYLKMYLDSRVDNDPALFVSNKKPYGRLSKNAIESILRKLGEVANVKNVHPHRFRRTMATNALNRGMPIEQVSKLLGHAKLDTTQIYCCIDQDNVRMSHRRYLAS